MGFPHRPHERETLVLSKHFGEHEAIGLRAIDAETPSGAYVHDRRSGDRSIIVETHAPELEDACASALIEAGYAPRVVTQRKRLASNRSWPPGTPGQNRWLVALGEASP